MLRSKRAEAACRNKAGKPSQTSQVSYMHSHVVAIHTPFVDVASACEDHVIN